MARRKADGGATSVVDSDQSQGLDTGYPGMYNVVLHNDDYTPMDFVVNVVMQVFEEYQGDRRKAAKFVWSIQRDGRGVAGTYVKSIADLKANLVRKIAETVSYPLKCSVEKAGG